MENTETIGNLLRRERESRNLSLQDVQDATKITAQNLSALEEDRFDYFPNRVYTRAFLRDYANYLGLDSAGLLQRYEQTYTAKPDPVVAAPVRRKSRLKVAFGVVLTIIVLGAVAGAGYIYYTGYGMRLSAVKPAPRSNEARNASGTTILPRAPVVPALPKPTILPPPVIPPKPVKPDVMTLRVAATHVVWIRVTADGKSDVLTMNPGEVKTWQAKKVIRIRAGKAGAVQLKWNGVTQPPLVRWARRAMGSFSLRRPPSRPPRRSMLAPLVRPRRLSRRAIRQAKVRRDVLNSKGRSTVSPEDRPFRTLPQSTKHNIWQWLTSACVLD